MRGMPGSFPRSHASGCLVSDTTAQAMTAAPSCSPCNEETFTSYTRVLQGFADGRAAAQWNVHRGIWARGGVPEGTAGRAGQRGVPGEPPGPTLCQAGAATCRNHLQSVYIKLLSLSLSSLGTSGATERPALLIMRGSPELLKVLVAKRDGSSPTCDWSLFRHFAACIGRGCASVQPAGHVGAHVVRKLSGLINGSVQTLYCGLFLVSPCSL